MVSALGVGEGDEDDQAVVAWRRVVAVRNNEWKQEKIVFFVLTNRVLLHVDDDSN